MADCQREPLPTQADKRTRTRGLPGRPRTPAAGPAARTRPASQSLALLRGVCRSHCRPSWSPRRPFRGRRGSARPNDTPGGPASEHRATDGRRRASHCSVASVAPVVVCPGVLEVPSAVGEARRRLTSTAQRITDVPTYRQPPLGTAQKPRRAEQRAIGQTAAKQRGRLPTGTSTDSGPPGREPLPTQAVPDDRGLGLCFSSARSAPGRHFAPAPGRPDAPLKHKPNNAPGSRLRKHRADCNGNNDHDMEDGNLYRLRPFGTGTKAPPTLQADKRTGTTNVKHAPGAHNASGPRTHAVDGTEHDMDANPQIFAFSEGYAKQAYA